MSPTFISALEFLSLISVNKSAEDKEEIDENNKYKQFLRPKQPYIQMSILRWEVFCKLVNLDGDGGNKHRFIRNYKNYLMSCLTFCLIFDVARTSWGGHNVNYSPNVS